MAALVVLSGNLRESGIPMPRGCGEKCRYPRVPLRESMGNSFEHPAAA
jgi:hypothetical protein